jgi:midasin (ATPase involved in ribosome maturation)
MIPDMLIYILRNWIELWGCSKPSNTKILQTFQSKTLRKLANAPWNISNVTLRNDLRIPYVTEVIRTYAKNHKNWTAQNNNQLIRDLFNQPEIARRLNRMWTEDLIR